VVLVKRKNTKSDKLFAMKIIDKKQIKEKNLLQTDYIEKVICTSDNPFLVRMLNTFQNQHKIYIVMEYVDGGDLYYYLSHEKFDETLIRKLIPEIVEAISFLHISDVIYRDLKPENVLVTTEGHVKITDFGLSCLSTDNEPMFTFAGILEYMAP
jgi:serine/threonine protein kinase